MWGGSLRCQWSRWSHGLPRLCHETGVETCLDVPDLPAQGSPAVPSLPPPAFPFLLTFTLADDTRGRRDLSLKHSDSPSFLHCRHRNCLLIGIRRWHTGSLWPVFETLRDWQSFLHCRRTEIVCWLAEQPLFAEPVSMCHLVWRLCSKKVTPLWQSLLCLPLFLSRS